ncbi:hypothetical protein CCAX7_41830 [Capsulimonas corticalis]|uniref:DUF6314 domain-containing protein n=1 Tax=Capsulimonas corticalis TaxID=2219043 RepID=A0A402CXX8_9BACT|nr:DUF6314 family protein [Capsulimonas corticalis]BDI32132.1 hypothetical protein CCAX7_41830 [Capsulimonas corticalis]
MKGIPTTENSNRLLARLRRVRQLAFTASSNSDAGWNAKGEGVVAIDETSPEQIVFRETGHWIAPNGKRFRFHNVYRWTRLSEEVVRLEHLRMGVTRPVLLFDLTPSGEACWVSVTGHQCKQDCYTAELWVEESGVQLEWIVEGPERRDVIGYVYE